jgi:hypothetical protein
MKLLQFSILISLGFGIPVQSQILDVICKKVFYMEWDFLPYAILPSPNGEWYWL